MFNRYQIRNYNFRLMMYVVIVSVIGILVIGSAEKSVQGAQIFGFILGIIAMLVISLVDYIWVLKFYWIIYVFNILMLLSIEIPGLGVVVNNSKRWLKILGFQFQPSELSKLLLILFFAAFFTKHREKISNWRILLASAVLLGPPLLLIKSQPDLSTTISIAVIFLVVLFSAGLSGKIIWTTIGVAVPIVSVFLYQIMKPGQTLLDDYQLRRILAWINPTEYVDEAYQQLNSVMAIGSGQLNGKGLNNLDVSSVKNGNFLAEPQTDFIFAVAGEELGFVGTSIIILLLALIVLECIYMGKKSKDFSGTLIGCGVAGYVGFQSFVNISVATGLLPNTGIPLPFVSYGLTSLVTLYMAIGFVLNVGLQPKKY